MMRIRSFLSLSCAAFLAFLPPQHAALGETAAEHNARMQWWRDARFGLFIHWGLYAIPAGTWEGTTDHGEWIRTTAHIPLEKYEELVQQFNPEKFDPAGWVRAAKDAGMKYIVITSKHHDGFCLFDAKQNDYDAMATPFHRDVMKALADECRRQGMRICWYYSIMDWHHPDYLPRRDWETHRSTAGTDYARYVRYMKAELKELLKNYGDIGVLWFDGEWESTWNKGLGRELYDYVRKLQPSIIINNRVGAGRSGMEGFSDSEQSAGDFGTPEQQVPATGLPGVDWETCMTMNDHWGYNSHDQKWKSPPELIRMLADIASKGGNFLLNIGPTADGEFPASSLERLKAIGSWMRMNGEAIYATQASPFTSLPWGRCTSKSIDGGARLYLHVFDWPKDGRLVVPGVFNEARQSYLLADPRRSRLQVQRREDALEITLPGHPADTTNTVVVLEITGKPDIAEPPLITADFPIFVDSLLVRIASKRDSVEVRFTTDGSVPTAASILASGSITLRSSVTVRARCFRNNRPVSGIAQSVYNRVEPGAAITPLNPAPGVKHACFQGKWDRLPDFSTLTAVKTGVSEIIGNSTRTQPENYAITFEGFIKVPETGVYRFYTESDDGSALFIGDAMVVQNDFLHGMVEASGVIALEAGYHPIKVTYFQKSGGDGLKVSWMRAGSPKSETPASALFH
jgi:alpha-L-fucosidase